MYHSRLRIVAEVEGGKLEEIDNQNDLREDEVSADEQHDECELKEIVEDKMTSDTSGGLDIGFFRGEQVPQVADLHEENDKPDKYQISTVSDRNAIHTSRVIHSAH
jgi:hypothetical protein